MRKLNWDTVIFFALLSLFGALGFYFVSRDTEEDPCKRCIHYEVEEVPE